MDFAKTKLKFLDDFKFNVNDFIVNDFIGDLDMASAVKLDQLPVEPTVLKDKDGNVLLEFILFTFYRTVAFGIISQTDKFFYNRNTDMSPEFMSSRRMLITSYHYPELRMNHVQLRGVGTSYDFDLCTLQMNNAKDAEAYKNKLLKALTEWGDWLASMEQPQEDVSTSSLES